VAIFCEVLNAFPRGRPPFLPRARAAARPAQVRSIVKARSNSATLENMEDELPTWVARFQMFSQALKLDPAFLKEAYDFK
jgi:hypothetical protein